MKTFLFIALFFFTTAFADVNVQVLETIQHADEIPGLKSGEFSALKTDIINTWTTLYKQGVIEVSGRDQSIRPSFVALQGIVEHVLASELQKNIKNLSGMIHTPMPATPLCTQGEISPELVDPSIALDPLRLFTIKARTTIIRDYLYKGGNLYIIYPSKGYDQRTEAQQTIYREALASYPDHLFDMPLQCEAIPLDCIGATYFFEDASGNPYVFAIKMTQAKNPEETGHFGLWFGSVHHPAIQKRLQVLEQNGISLPAKQKSLE